ncbi:TrbC/VirB2 family protein [Polaromonas aquatica]|uniref:TrbC/VirB2 family protein n=1 Tax=Polaromonas aquatica TaxID=332657 RepID=A0ABW1TUI8_9BURK
MIKTIKSKLNAMRQIQWNDQNFKAVVTSTLVAALLTVMPLEAMAQSFDIPFITTFGCGVVKWLKGPLAILIFVLVVIATLVIGMISKMDWSRIISVCVVFGIIIGLGGILANSSYFQAMPAMQSCLA